MPDVGREWLNRMYFGDCVKSLNAMPAGFVNTCVTSPPYYGLRDYGSGRWEGGDPGHDHAAEVGTRQVGRNDGDRYGEGTNNFTGQKKTARAMRPSFRRDRAEVIPTQNAVGACSCGAVYMDEQLGQEETPEDFIQALVGVFRAVRRVLRDDGTIWVNMGDSYNSAPKGNPGNTGNLKSMGKRAGENDPAAGRGLIEGLKPKDLIGVPWMLAFALRADGWYLRQDVIWSKPSCMPESIKDRCTKSHEYIFLLAKSEKYYFDMDAIMEPSVSAGQYQKVKSNNGRPTRALASQKWKPSGNEKPGAPPVLIKEMRHKRSVWNVSPKGYSGAHFATYPEELIEPCILAGSPARGVVLDPFMGSGTTAAVAARLERYWVGCELNDSNHMLQLERLGRTWMYEEPTAPRTRVRLNGAVDRVRLD